MPEFINDLETILTTHSALVNPKKSLHVLFNITSHGCQKDYPVALVHEECRIKEADALSYFKNNHLLDEEGLSYEEYPRADLEKISQHTPKYIQNVGFMLFKTTTMTDPTFSNKFEHDFWKKIQNVESMEAVIDMSELDEDSSDCQVEESLRAIIRKRKEVHQLKKLTFVWIVEIKGENKNVETVMKHYFNEDYKVLKSRSKTYYMGWSDPLQSINMRYFVCPPE
ncbi:MAG: hypothetical protein GQ531_10755 [Sulfurovum sp.]|nr:hypothetical protein [Sulfurovum sp.]